jgi:serine/threonine protein kinase/tetratricopeptide (TPR) repeat protein
MTVETLFALALEKPAGAEREAFLEAACGGDAELRERIDHLLRADDHPSGILDNTPAVPTVTSLPDALTRDRVFAGRFKLREKLGEGGMGEVWVADQTEPVQRRVALKVVRPGHDSDRLVARFEQERQALALMDHPNIARVLDAGVAEGRPYFVMELIKGEPITTYCDAAKLSPRERLELFLPVCHAVQHAHQKGIIHRDLKPSNIMIGLYDGKPVPKVIDFGVAKATGPRLTEKSIYTEVGSLIGTLEYMSPEQAELNNLDVDTRSDIYALGAVLYELLTGSVPFPKQQLQAAAFTEMLRMIKEVEPPKPSTRLSHSGTLPSIAAVRQTEPKKLVAQMRGELDWIVMKCLEKDRRRRYETTNGLALDLQRFLSGEPVQAVPPSAGYRLRKFLRRNKGPALATGLVLLALVGGVVGTAIGLVRAEERAEGERRAKVTAEKRLDQIEKGIDLLGSLFADLDPFAEERQGRPLRAILRDRLDQTAAELEGEVIGDPLIVARLQDRLGQTYLGLGSAKRAEALFAKSMATREAELGADHPLTLASHHNRAAALEAAGKRIEAIRRFERVRDDRDRVLGTDHPDTLTTLHGLAVVYREAGRVPDAIRLLEQVRDVRVKRLGPTDDLTLAARLDLAEAYRSAVRRDEAIALAEVVREDCIRKYGDVHPRAIDATSRLASIYQTGFKMSAALDLYQRTETVTLQKLGPHHPLTLKIQSGLGHMVRVYGRTREAIALLESVRDRRVMVLGGDHPATLYTIQSLALAYQDANERDKALSLFEQVATSIEKLDYAHYDADRFVNNLARYLEQTERYEQAEVWRRKWLAVAKERDGPESFRYVGFNGLAGLGVNLVRQRKYAEAEAVLCESVAVLQKIPAEWERHRARSLLGDALLGRQKYADAEPHLVESYQEMAKLAQTPEHQTHADLHRGNLSVAAERLVRLYEATNRPAEAAKWRKELESLRPKAKEPAKK